MADPLTVTEVQAFFADFAAREWEALENKWTEPSGRVAQAAALALADFANYPAVSPLAQRSDDLNAEQLARYRGQLDNYGRRQLFVIREVQAPGLGPCFECTASPLDGRGLGGRPAGDYGDRFYIAPVQGQLKIIARTTLCSSCDGSGQAWSSRCRDCRGSGWERAGGLAISGPVTVLACHRITPPANPRDRADYDREP